MAKPSATLEDRLGIALAKPQLLAQALVHGSYTPERGLPSNQRLEFLGDAVLDLVVADLLFSGFAALDEGGLSKARISVVNEAVLAEVAESIDLGAELLVGRGAEAEGARTKPSVLSDAFEAVIGAVYLSDGLVAARDLVLRLMGDRIAAAAISPGAENFKGMLNEWAQAVHGIGVSFSSEQEGPSHEPSFTAEARLGDQVLATGTGRSKKAAEIDAARTAWRKVGHA